MLRPALLLACVSCACAADGTQVWLYPETLFRGPKYWGALEDARGNPMYPACSAGRAQSPVNIAGSVADATLKPLNMSYTPAEGFQMTNKQQHISLTAAAAGAALGFLEDPNQGGKRYNLEEIVLRSPSEHALGGGLLDMEVQFVHHEAPAAGTGTSEDAKKKVVVSVLFASSNAPNAHLNFFDALPARPDASFEHYRNRTHNITHARKTDTRTLHFEALMRRKEFYAYEGSHTTPPCTEEVMWYVMQDVNVMSIQQRDALRRAMLFAEEEALARSLGYAPDVYDVHGNARPLQPLNGRTVRASADCAGIVHPADDEDRSHWVLGMIGTVFGAVSLLLLCIVVAMTKSATTKAADPVP